MAKSIHKMVVISTLNNSKKESLSISIPETEVTLSNIKDVVIIMIGTDTY